MDLSITPYFQPMLPYPRDGYVSDGLIFTDPDGFQEILGHDVFEFDSFSLPNGTTVWIWESEMGLFYCSESHDSNIYQDNIA